MRRKKRKKSLSHGIHEKNQIVKEKGVIRKRWHGRLPVALVFPDSYAIGMSNLGFQTVYDLLNSYDFIVAERFFMPDNPMELAGPLRSCESNRAIDEFPVIAFSISFETGYINVVRILHQADLPIYAKNFGTNTPLIVAGGVATQINPEPLAPFVDFFLLGDFEALAPPFVEFLETYSFPFESLDLRYKKIFSFAVKTEGVYVPSFYNPVHDPNYGVLKGWEIKDGAPFPVNVVRYTGVLETAPYTVVTSNRAAFSDMFNVELVRGCGRGCRFCAAGFIYRPPRVWPPSAVKDAVAKGRKLADRVGLVGLEFTSASDLQELCISFVNQGLELAFSSIRADAVSEDFAELLKFSGVKMATIAPEAGSSRMRRAINKNLSEEQIIEALKKMADAGILNFKLYFMTGLPFEEREDVEAIVTLCEKIYDVLVASGRVHGRLGNVTVSVNSFVPKAWTPMQWAEFNKGQSIVETRRFLKKEIDALPNFKIKFDSLDAAITQAVLSRGDRQISKAIEIMVVSSIGWKQALMETGLSVDNYLRGRGENDIFPWEIAGHPIARKFLLSEWHNVMKKKQTSFCRPNFCRKCGACLDKSDV